MTRHRAQYEHQDASVRVAVIGLGGVLVLLAVGLELTALIMPTFEGHQRLPPARPAATPRPRLETRPAESLEAVQERARRRLQSYGWNDAARTSAHIPLDRALSETARRGWADDEGAP